MSHSGNRRIRRAWRASRWRMFDWLWASHWSRYWLHIKVGTITPDIEPPKGRRETQ